MKDTNALVLVLTVMALTTALESAASASCIVAASAADSGLPDGSEISNPVEARGIGCNNANAIISRFVEINHVP